MSDSALMADKRQLCTFSSGDGCYAVDVLDVREVNTETDVTPVSHAPKGVRGLVNVRGQVFLIFDIGLLLGYGTSGVSEKSRLVLFKERVGPTFGILVDAVGDILEFRTSELVTRRRSEALVANEHDPNAHTEMDGLIRGVCKFEEQLVVLLEPRRLLEV